MTQKNATQSITQEDDQKKERQPSRAGKKIFESQNSVSENSPPISSNNLSSNTSALSLDNAHSTDDYSLFGTNESKSIDNALLLGNRIRAEREKQGITSNQVSQELRIHIKYIEAIDENRWGFFNNATYARGFIRNYAKLLGLDVEEDLYALFPVTSYTHEPLKNIDAVSTPPFIPQTKRPLLFIFFGFLLILLIIALLIVGMSFLDETFSDRFRGFNFLSTTTETQNVSSGRQIEVILPNAASRPSFSGTTTSNNPSQDVVLPSSIKDDAPSSQSTLNDQRLSLANSSTPSLLLLRNTVSSNPKLDSAPSRLAASPSSLVDTSNPVHLLNLLSVPTPSTTPSQNENILMNIEETPLSTVSKKLPLMNIVESVEKLEPEKDNQENTLLIRAGAISWIQINTIEGKQILTRTIKKDNVLKHKISPPFQLIVGNAKAPSTSIHYDGKQLDLDPHLTNNGNARIVIR